MSSKETTTTHSVDGWRSSLAKIVAGLISAALLAAASAYVTLNIVDYRVAQAEGRLATAEQEIRALREARDLTNMLERLAKVETTLAEGGRYTQDERDADERRHELVHAGIESRFDRIERRLDKP